ncbi:MAG: shikimate dehydrogenase [Bacteroidia bacterium]|nr:shikimate dehydrogenase [Bacteroidia bacterium]
MRLFGLIGYPLEHSFSQKYFTAKFKDNNIIDVDYELFPIDVIEKFSSIISKNPNLIGLNVTIPYKEQVIQYLNELDKTASEINAVNTIKIHRENDHIRTIGYNTDVYGFEISLKPLLKAHHNNALILGSGGASKAVSYVLQKLNIPFQIVSRESHTDQLSYSDIPYIIKDHPLIINTTPVGSFPDTGHSPNIPYELLDENYLLFDLIYNPEETEFLKQGKAQGAIIKNGLEMLELQAEKAWEIWNAF